MHVKHFDDKQTSVNETLTRANATLCSLLFPRLLVFLEADLVINYTVILRANNKDLLLYMKLG